jgi:hypothetical protein
VRWRGDGEARGMVVNREIVYTGATDYRRSPWHQIYPKKRNGWGMGKSEHIECIWATMVEGVWFGEGKNWGSNLQT